MDTIKYEDFAKAELVIGTIVEAKLHPNADKLLVLAVNIGTETRQIVAGISKHYTPEELKGQQIVVVLNLEPRALRGEMSHGMLLATSDDEGNLALIQPGKIMKAGSRVK